MDQPPKLPRILMVLSYAFATLCAVAASKSDLTDEPYDVIMRVSLEKPACMRCTYWRRPARHYSKAGNDARASQRELIRTGLRPLQILDRRDIPPSEPVWPQPSTGPMLQNAISSIASRRLAMLTIQNLWML